MDKENVEYTYNGILFNLTKRRDTALGKQVFSLLAASNKSFLLWKKKKKEILSYATKWMNFKDIMLSKIIQ